MQHNIPGVIVFDIVLNIANVNLALGFDILVNTFRFLSCFKYKIWQLAHVH